jgi:diguanylate cyclase (GGDEF)-like protein
MNHKLFLVLNPVAASADDLSRRVRKHGGVAVATTLAEAITHLESKDIQVLVVDLALAPYANLQGLLRATTCVLVTGADGAALRRAAEEWPPEFYVDTVVFDPLAHRDKALDRALERAAGHAVVKKEARDLKFAHDLQEAKIRDVRDEVREIKSLINTNFLREIEKRIAIEAKYIWFQRERQQIESTLRKIYAADDVSTLLDIMPDIKDIVQASGTTVYVVEESETLGRYLKPVVWDNTFPSHADFSKYMAPLDSQDFAAAVARFGQEIVVADLSFDRRMSKRYVDHLRVPLKNLLGIPIRRDREVIGVVEVYNKTVQGKIVREGFSREDVEILRGLTEHIANAMTKLNLIHYDPLTGLLRPNPFFEKVLQKINTQSKRRLEGGANALVMGDVDWFKNYNDRNGHEAGNRLLRELAQILKMSIREEDLICRYGGEEFLFFLTGVKSLEEAAHLTERIRKNVEGHYFDFQEFQPRNNLTMSFGVTVFPGGESDISGRTGRADMKRLISEADLAMAEAKGKERPDLPSKETGGTAQVKNRVCLHSRATRPERSEDGRPAPHPAFEERRKHERFNLSTQLLFRDDGGYKAAKTVNLSLGGARIVSEVELPVAKAVDVMLVLGDKGDLLKSDVVYSEKASSESPLFYSGLKFRDLTFGEMRLIEDYLLQFRRRDIPDS